MKTGNMQTEPGKDSMAQVMWSVIHMNCVGQFLSDKDPYNKCFTACESPMWVMHIHKCTSKEA